MKNNLRFICSISLLIVGCTSNRIVETNPNLYGEWFLKESRCDDMVVKSSFEQKIIIYKGYLTLKVRQGECSFKNTMPYTVSNGIVDAIGPGEYSCESKGCPATVTLTNQLGGKDTMKLECPAHERDEVVDFLFKLDGEKLVQFSKNNPNCDLIYVK